MGLCVLWSFMSGAFVIPFLSPPHTHTSRHTYAVHEQTEACYTPLSYSQYTKNTASSSSFRILLFLFPSTLPDLPFSVPLNNKPNLLQHYPFKSQSTQITPPPPHGSLGLAYFHSVASTTLTSQHATFCRFAFCFIFQVRRVEIEIDLLLIKKIKSRAYINQILIYDNI